jgi:hypothetical protein
MMGIKKRDVYKVFTESILKENEIEHQFSMYNLQWIITLNISFIQSLLYEFYKVIL